MAKDKYISMKESVSGFSFANLGVFTGFADGIYNAVYSLVILGIFGSSAVVGVYVALYSAFCMLVALFAGEVLRFVSKSRLFYASMLGLTICYAMMSFSIKPFTFIALDYTTGIAITFVGVLIPLFMADFSKNIGMAKLNARYHLWLNVGALFAPMIAVGIANHFGNRAAFFASAIIYAMGWMFFKYFRIVQEDKNPRRVNPRKTVHALGRTARAFFTTPGMLRAYIVNFGYYSLRAMRYLYVPIVVIENGFSKDTLGMVLTLGIVPYLILSEPMGRLARRFGARFWLTLGFMSFAIFSMWATVAQGWTLLAIFVLWQISGACMESVHDLLFFDTAKKAQQTRFYGVFRTSVNMPNVLAPMLAAGCIAVVGTTASVWLVTAAIGVVSTIVLWSHK